MTLTINLTIAEEQRLAVTARQQGLAPAAWVQNLIAENLPASVPPEQDPMLALFAQWEEEDANMTSEEVTADNQQWHTFKDNVNAERDRAGARRVF